MTRRHLFIAFVWIGSALGQPVPFSPGPFPPFPPKAPPPELMVPPKGPPKPVETVPSPLIDTSITVRAPDGRGVPGVTVLLSRMVRTTTPRYVGRQKTFDVQERFVATSDQNGVARFSELPSGYLAVCLSPPEPYLSPCQWGQPLGLNLPKGPQKGFTVSFAVERGVIAELAVKDPARLLKNLRVDDPIQRPLKVGLLQASGEFHSARVVKQVDGEVDFIVVYPATAKVWPVYYSDLFDTKSTTGLVTPGVGSRAESWSESERVSGKHTVELVPTQRQRLSQASQQ